MAPIPKGLLTGVGKLIAGLFATVSATGRTTIEEPSPRGFLTGVTGAGLSAFGWIADKIAASCAASSPLSASRIVAVVSALVPLETLETDLVDLLAMIETLTAPFTGGAPGWAKPFRPSTHSNREGNQSQPHQNKKF